MQCNPAAARSALAWTASIVDSPATKRRATDFVSKVEDAADFIAPLCDAATSAFRTTTELPLRET